VILKFWYYGDCNLQIVKKFKKVNDYGTTIWPYFQVQLSKNTIDIIFNEKYEILQQLFRRIKIEKMNTNSIKFDNEFLIFYIENIDNINITK